MQISWQNIFGGVGLVIAAMIAWFGALWLNLQGMNLWFVRLCIFLLLGLAVVAVVWWFHNRQKNKPAADATSSSEDGGGVGVADDILLLLGEAEARVAASTQLPRGTRLSSLPVIFLIGNSGAGKTCVATQSGLEPELLSGQIYQDGAIAPTRLANLWFARKTVFVEIGGKTLGDANSWNRLLHRLSRGKIRSIFSGKPAAPRAAVVCYDSEKLAKAAGPEEITAQSRAIRGRLEQISQTLGISFPVYVMFTRADRLPYFDEFFRNLSDAEITQVLGVTLPPVPASATGVYAEQETKRLTNAFNSIYYSLAECRPGLLYRERNSEKLAGIYEFPRELQKRIAIATQFLVDLCRPSHLRSGPFLRGFYFTGMRQVEAATSIGGGTLVGSKTSVMPAPSFSPNATSIMRAEDFAPGKTQGWQTATQGGAMGESRKTPQWLFLSHCFSHVILQDRAALGASGTSSRANVLRRVLLGIVGAIALVWFVGMTISFFGNHGLERDVRSAAEAIAPIKEQAPSAASLEDLQRLDAARLQLMRLEEYERNRVPWSLRWGLYSGEDLYRDFRPLYFDRFKKLLFGEVQTQMGSYLRTRPDTPTSASDDDYNITYNNLKAYLMTTLKPERTDPAFLAQYLQGKWSADADSPEQNRLARAQFDFYANEVKRENPFPTQDPLVTLAVDQSRRYLQGFTSATLVYRGYLVKLRQNCKCGPIDFSKKYADAQGVVREPKIVDAAFTKDGWKAMQSLISRNDWNSDDEWVLGPGVKESITHGINSADILKAYQTDYIREWRDYLKSASIVNLGGPSDADKKLEKLIGNRSPLFELLCEVSENTSVGSPEIGMAFQPVSDVVKAPCSSLLAQDSTKSYMNALGEFKLCIDRFQENPADPATQREDYYKSCRTQNWPVVQKEAGNTVKTVDHEAELDKCVVNLLKLGGCAARSVPIPPPVSDAFCSALNSLSSKYPFRAESADDASLDEFEKFFRPGTGILSKEIASSGGRGGSHASLLKMGEVIQKSLYPGGSTTLQYHFSISTTVPSGMKSAQLDLDGTQLKAEGNAGQTQNFVWPGKAHEAELKVGERPYSGPIYGTWAVFHLLQGYSWSAGKGGYHLVSLSFQGPEGAAFKHNLELKTDGVPLFKRGYLAALRCSGKSGSH